MELQSAVKQLNSGQCEIFRHATTRKNIVFHDLEEREKYSNCLALYDLSSMKFLSQIEIDERSLNEKFNQLFNHYRLKNGLQDGMVLFFAAWSLYAVFYFATRILAWIYIGFK